jgi:FixJ family two-component response regulator
MTLGAQRDVWIGIVDDDVSCREALEGLLRAHGYSTLCFASAEDVLDLGLPAGLACLILDIRMGGMTGLELHDRLTTEGKSHPTVFISSFDDPPTRARALDAGALGFLGKPFDHQALLSLIEALAPHA